MATSRNYNNPLSVPEILKSFFDSSLYHLREIMPKCLPIFKNGKGSRKKINAVHLAGAKGVYNVQTLSVVPAAFWEQIVSSNNIQDNAVGYVAGYFLKRLIKMKE